jgi:rod shape-determining protein MreB
MFLSNYLNSFSKDISIDLGTANTFIYVKDKGIIIDEPSIVTVNTKTDQIVSVGKEAQKMVGKTPRYLETISPLDRGVISDFEVASKMIKYFFDKVNQNKISFFNRRPSVITAIPLDMTEVERKAVEDAILAAGARKVLLVESVLASAIGARLPIHDAQGNMIINFGAGRTEIAVISLGGVVTWKSLKLAGIDLNNNIVDYVRNEFNISIGRSVADYTKKQIGTATSVDEIIELKIRGKDLLSGLPKEITINNSQIYDATHRAIHNIIDEIKTTLEVTPPDLVADIFENGILLTGGIALLKGIDQEIQKALKIPVQVADDPITTVVRGTGIILEDLENLKDVIMPSTQQESAL